ncbi:MAG: hypothetical protein U9N45_04255, partial [Gemmatimonadota bacterium]|nr:hypothetical protein [Gemmatimonadota bacterium]
ERFAAKGALLLAPSADNPAFEKELENIVSRLLSREELRAEIAQAGWSLVDGKGVQRLKSKLKSCKVAKWQSGKGKARHKGT